MITLKNVSKRYDNVPVLNEINLEINRGSFCCITGKSGAGKSTLLKIISGMEKPDEGQVFFEGKDLKKSSVKNYGGGIFHLYFKTIFFWTTRPSGII